MSDDGTYDPPGHIAELGTPLDGWQDGDWRVDLYERRGQHFLCATNTAWSGPDAERPSSEAQLDPRASGGLVKRLLELKAGAERPLRAGYLGELIEEKRKLQENNDRLAQAYEIARGKLDAATVTLEAEKAANAELRVRLDVAEGIVVVDSKGNVHPEGATGFLRPARPTEAPAWPNGGAVVSFGIPADGDWYDLHATVQYKDGLTRVESSSFTRLKESGSWPSVPGPEDYIEVVFDGPPVPESGRFVEVESPCGTSINFGSWINRRDGTWALRFRSWARNVEREATPPEAAPAGSAVPGALLDELALALDRLGSPSPGKPTGAELVAWAIKTLADEQRRWVALGATIGVVGDGEEDIVMGDRVARIPLLVDAQLLRDRSKLDRQGRRVQQLGEERDEAVGALFAMARLMGLKEPYPSPDEICACALDGWTGQPFAEPYRIRIRAGEKEVEYSAPDVAGAAELFKRVRESGEPQP